MEQLMHISMNQYQSQFQTNSSSVDYMSDVESKKGSAV